MIVSSHLLFGQNKEVIKENDLNLIITKAQKALDEKNIGDYIQLTGIVGTLECLEPAYCHNDGAQGWYPNPGWSLVPTFDHYEWEIIYDGQVLNNLNPNLLIVSSGGAVADFYPTELADAYLSKTIEVRIYQVTSSGYRATYIGDLTTVLPSPEKFTVSGPTDICFGETAQIDLDGSELNVRYSLYNGGTYVTLKDGTGNSLGFPVTTSGVYTIVAETVAGGCVEDMSGSVILTVHPLPTINIGSNSPICEDETIFLTSDGGVDYSWTGPDTFTSTDQNPSITNATTNMSGLYEVVRIRRVLLLW